MKISASILSADYLNLGKDIGRAAEAGCELLHIDVMDGHFVPNIAVGICTVEALRAETRLRKDAHLMISNPDTMIGPFIEAGADSVTFHAEATPHHIRLIRDIQRAGRLAGIALTPETPAEAVRCALEEADIVLQVSVCVGFGGQAIIEFVYDKLATLREWKERYGYRYEIQVDGGISEHTYKKALANGAEVLVAGSMLFGAEDMKKTVRSMRAAAF
jgi:ribulose-phosphate 3-epimerase